MLPVIVPSVVDHELGVNHLIERVAIYFATALGLHLDASPFFALAGSGNLKPPFVTREPIMSGDRRKAAAGCIHHAEVSRLPITQIVVNILEVVAGLDGDVGVWAVESIHV